MNKILPALLAAIVLAVVGCAAIPTHTQLSTSNPANPHAAEADFPAAQPFLTIGENYAMSSQAEAKPMEMDTKKEIPAHRHGEPAAPPQHEHHQDNSPK